MHLFNNWSQISVGNCCKFWQHSPFGHVTLKLHLPGIIFTRSLRKMPPLLKNLCINLQTICFFSISWSHMPSWSFHVELCCSGPFTRRLFRIAGRFYCFTHFLSSTFDTLGKYFYIAKFTYPENRDMGVNNLSAGGLASMMIFFQWKIILKDLKLKDNYNKGTFIFKTVPTCIQDPSRSLRFIP